MMRMVLWTRFFTALLLAACFAVSGLPALQSHAQSRQDNTGAAGESNILGIEADENTSAQSCKTINGLVVLTQFPDISHRVPRQRLETRYFKQLDAYIRQMSYGKFCVGGELTSKVYELPDPIAAYKISDRNLLVDPMRIEKLMSDTVGMVGKDYDLSKYDFVEISLIALPTEYGMGGLCGYPSHTNRYNDRVNESTGHQIRYGSGIPISVYTATLGTVFHDIAHVLAGRDKDGLRVLPHLYDNTIQSKPGPMLEMFRKSQINAGYWDPMSCHFVERGVPPPGLLAWTKLKLGWIEEDKVRTVKAGETADIVLDPLEVGSSDVLVIRLPVTKDTYYLIENRQPIGVDKNLPGHGVLITFADDRVHRALDGKTPAKLMNANPDIPDLNGAAFDIGKNERFVDKKNGITIELLRKTGLSYEIRIAR
jgi:M6 family metalloprotease-like protein